MAPCPKNNVFTPSAAVFSNIVPSFLLAEVIPGGSDH